MLRPNDRLATVASALRASTSEPNLRKKQLNSGNTGSGSNNSVKESKPEKSARDLSKQKSKKVSRSSSSESSDTEEKEYLKAELILKFKKYDHAWFKPSLILNTLSTSGSMPITKEPEQVLVRNSPNSLPNNGRQQWSDHHDSKLLPSPAPLHGFDKAVFAGQDKIVASFLDYLRVFLIGKHGYGLREIRCDGAVASIQISPDFAYLAVAVDAVQGAKVVIYDTREMDEALREFTTIVLATQVRISLTNEIILLLGESEDRQHCRVCIYAFDGTFLAELTVTLESPASSFEVSFCPADETIICLFASEVCYFMRATTNVITIFSSIRLFDVTCHAWADDVTLSFGTVDGHIRLYRETVPLEVIDLKVLQDNLIGTYDVQQSHVLRMYGNDQYLLVYVQIGVIFVFPAGDLKERWQSSKAIILNSLKPDTSCTLLHMDLSNDNILYGDTESISLCNVHYAEAICDDGLRLITAKHSRPIKQLCYEHRSKKIAVLDKDGLILVTSMENKRTISHGLMKGVVGIALLPDGQKMLIATENGISLYHVLLHELLKGEKLWNEKVEALVQNQTSDLLAIANASTLSVIAVEGFITMFQIPLESNQTIITLKWSASSDYIGIIANKDTLYLIDVRTATIIWSHEYKLRFFVDIALQESIIFALGNKFTVARFQDKKELDPMNVHFEGVSFKSTSTTVVTTPVAYYYGTKMGTLLRASADNVENVQQIKMGNIKGISTMLWVKSENILFTGHDDGNVMILDLNTDRARNLPITDFENIALCRINVFEKNKFLAKELEVERNLIRNQAKRIFEEYKAKKELEIKELNETLETNMQAMRDKIKVMENKFEASEAAKEEVIAKLKSDFQVGINEQKTFYENMINDQIKASLEKDDTSKKCMETVQKMHREEVRKLQREWDSREKDLLRELAKNKANTDKVRKKLFESESLRKMTIQQVADEEKKYYQTIRGLKQKCDEEQKQFAATVKDLKATILIIENEKGAEVQNVRQQKIRLEALSEELAENQNIFDEKNALIEKLQDQISKLQRDAEKQNKQIQKLSQKTTIVSKDIEQEKLLRRNAESRLKAFESMVEAMSLEIYDARRLEKNALAMLAFFKSPNPLLQRSKSHVVHRTVARKP